MRKTFYLLLILAFATCKKDDSPVIPVYPDEPTIKFKSAEFSKGIDLLGNQIINLELCLDYTDGDTNLGGNFNLDESEAGEYEYDCVVTSYKKINEEFSLYGLHPDLNPMYICFPEISNLLYEDPVVKIHPRNIVEGELIINVTFAEAVANFAVNDTLKYTVQILDRDYNFSNLAEIEKIYSLSK